MPDLLLELLSEEIPARMQRRAGEDLQKLITGGLVDAGLTYEGAKAFWTPRRLALTVHGIPVRSPDLREERRGPRVGAPEKAIAGFLRGAGLGSIADAEIRSIPGKGDFHVALVEKPGRPALEILAEVIEATVRSFPWPKSMRWGDTVSEPDAIRWVRPLISILATFGSETEEVDIVPVKVGGYRAGTTTVGHRFHAPRTIAVRRFDDYAASLYAARVVLDPERRKSIIIHDMKDQALALGLEVVEDPGLLEEVSGLVEWPIVLCGSFDERFLALPDEVIRLTIRENQKCFVLRHQSTGALANRFVLTANLVASDGGVAIVAGNERVVRARLSDAEFFFRTDKATALEVWLEKLRSVVFHQKLGTQFERVERIVHLAGELAPELGADADLVARAARLAKADLATGMVGEFPELQGQMGGVYALSQGEHPAVCQAIEQHYRPVGPTDEVPTDPVAVAVALADKLDILVSFWAINEKPTGSRDPYALRRAALGVIRLILENGLRLPLGTVLASHAAHCAASWSGVEAASDTISESLPDFFADRLKVQLRDRGLRHDLIDAVFALEGQDDLVAVVRRVEALSDFLASEDGSNLLAGYKRAANILRAEEKKSAAIFSEPVEPGLLAEDAERALYSALQTAADEAGKAIRSEDFEAAMVALAALRAPVDMFFEAILVNDDNPAIRQNRLRLLTRLRNATSVVADLSRVEG